MGIWEFHMGILKSPQYYLENLREPHLVGGIPTPLKNMKVS